MPEEIHESAKRLYEAAREMRGVTGKSAVAHLLNESPQALHNWEGPRGVSEGGALKAQRVIGCDANWLRSGEGSPLAGWPFSSILKGAVMQLTPEQRDVIDNTLRAMLKLPLRDEPKPTEPPVTVTRQRHSRLRSQEDQLADLKKSVRSTGKST